MNSTNTYGLALIEIVSEKIIHLAAGLKIEIGEEYALCLAPEWLHVSHNSVQSGKYTGFGQHPVLAFLI